MKLPADRRHRRDVPESPVSILVADAHSVVRDGLSCLFDRQADFRVVGEAENCEELCSSVVNLRPDVVLVDLEMEDATGAQALVRLREITTDSRVLVFTACKADYLVFEILKYDVQGILLKTASYAHLCQAVRTTKTGGLYLCPVVAKALRRRFAQPTRFACGSPGVFLTDREYAVLTRMAEGRRNRNIAEEFGISERAVKYHVSSVLAKIGARNRAEAVEKAVNLKLIPY